METRDYLAIAFFVGLTVIYIPQYYKIIRSKCSVGFNPWFLFLGHTAAFISWVNSQIYYLRNWRSCQGDWDCTQQLYGFSLLIFQWLLFLIFYILYICFFETIPNEYHPLPDSNRQFVKRKCIGILKINSKTKVVVHFLVSVLIGLVAQVITLTLLSQNNWNGDDLDIVQVWSIILDVITTLMFTLHYFPQIWETIRLKRVGSLSLVTLGIMCPGTFVWTYFLATQKSGAVMVKGIIGPLVWIPYLVTGVLQSILFIIGTYYSCKERRLNTYVLTLNNDDFPENNVDSD